MSFLLNLWYSQFPHWARPEHPIMRSVMRQGPRTFSLRHWPRILLVLTILGIAGAVSYLGNNQEFNLREILYIPLLLAQAVAVILGLILTANAVAVEEQRGTWDSLKLTLVGVPLSLRARWIAVFHQLWWLLGIIILLRMVFLGLLMRDLMDFQGRALDLYISGITPAVSLDVAILLMVAFMTGFIMQPIIAVAASAALGVILSVTVRSRAMVFIFMLLFIGLYLGLVYLGIALGDETILTQTETFTPTTLSESEGWGVLYLMSLHGDMALKLTQLEVQGQVWAEYDKGIYWGGLYLGLIMVSGMVANLLVEISAKRAAKPTRH